MNTREVLELSNSVIFFKEQIEYTSYQSNGIHIIWLDMDSVSFKMLPFLILYRMKQCQTETGMPVAQKQTGSSKL